MISDYVLGRKGNGTAPWAVLAPLTGLSDLPFRRLVHRYGADLVVTEMVAAAEYVRGHEVARLKAEGEGISPHVIQLVGCDPGSMAEAARLAESAGADVIDINFGCPAKRVSGGRLAGAALLRDHDGALALAGAVVDATKLPVTVKMRLGWDDASRNAHELAPRLAASGVRALTVHGRTRQQFYNGQADWGAIALTVRSVAVPVTANGDISTVADARRALLLSGASGVMIGRAAIGQPWLVGQVAAALRGLHMAIPEAGERLAVALEHHDALLTLYGRDIGLRCARKHLAAYADRARADGYRFSDEDRHALVIARDEATVAELLRRVFAAPGGMLASREAA